MKKHILLAEDNKDLADILSVTLAFFGYEIVVIADGLKAVESAISLHPDLIVIDMMMPKMDGFQAVPQLRHHPETKNIPILAHTALALGGDRERCLAIGCDDYISKPCTPKELAAAIQRLLQRTSAEKPNALNLPRG